MRAAELDGVVRRELPLINKRLPSEAIGRLSCRRSLIGRVSMLTQAISLVLLCLGVAAFVADSALGPPMLATAGDAGRAHATPLVCDPFVLGLFGCAVPSLMT